MADLTFPASPHVSSSHSFDTVSLDMKDVAQNKHSRNSLVYPKKRPSPHGVSKAHKSPLMPANGVSTRRTPRSQKYAQLQLQQRQREAQIQALRREGIFLEEEYMDEVHRYMLDMEVGPDHYVN